MKYKLRKIISLYIHIKAKLALFCKNLIHKAYLDWIGYEDYIFNIEYREFLFKQITIPKMKIIISTNETFNIPRDNIL